MSTAHKGINPKMRYVSTPLNVPVFLLRRNSYRRKPLNLMLHISKHSTLYNRRCGKEEMNATMRKFKHIVGLYEFSPSKCVAPRPLKGTRALTKAMPYHLAPNRYGVPRVPYVKFRGDGGAHWAKVHRKRVGMRSWSKPQFKFYELPNEMERFAGYAYKHTGIFLDNARNRQPTSRIMVSSLSGCPRNPNEPGPSEYTSELHMMAYNAGPSMKYDPPNPHLFLRHSCVPAKPNAIHAKHMSFAPGPGRYEVRYPRVCFCPSRFLYGPDITLYIERQARLRYRRLPYDKVYAKLYCSPEWRHVPGRGHTWLFKGAKPLVDTRLNKQAARKPNRDVMDIKLYPDARYIGMINNPTRQSMSFRDEPMPSLPVTVRYNCTAKRIIRKQLRINKKIAFMSGQPRFKDADRPPILTVSQQEKMKASLPIERQLHDYPVIRCSLSDIQSKLHETPQHMMPYYELDLRKRLFKFLPLPGPKVLVTEEDIRPPLVDGHYDVEPFFGKKISPVVFFRGSVVQQPSKTE